MDLAMQPLLGSVITGQASRLASGAFRKAMHGLVPTPGSAAEYLMNLLDEDGYGHKLFVESKFEQFKMWERYGCECGARFQPDQWRTQWDNHVDDHLRQVVPLYVLDHGLWPVMKKMWRTFPGSFRELVRYVEAVLS